MPNKHVYTSLLIGFLLLLAPLSMGISIDVNFVMKLKKIFYFMDILGAWSPLVFIAINIIFVVFILPGLFITLGAGFFFGFTEGVAIVVTGTTIGALISFNLSRYFFGGRVKHYLKNHPKLKMIDEQFAQEGMLFIMLTRIVPFFPFKLSNYFFGLAQFTQKQFLLGTAIGIVPITCVNVYLGSIVPDIEMLFSGNANHPARSWWAISLGALSFLIVFYYITDRANMALLRYVKEQHKL